MGRKVHSVDDVIKKNFINENTAKISQNFAIKFKENVINIIHNCNIRTLITDITHIRNSIYITPPDELEIRDILRTLNHNKGAGIDGIRPKDIKMHADVLAKPITEFVNASLNECIVPDILKTSIVRPIFKSGIGNDYNNYRPISILPIIEKVLEEIIVRRLTDFLVKYRIVHPHQYGFQKGKNINKLLGNFTNFVNNCLENKMHCLVLFIDFSKAFDTLSHVKLLEMLERNGIRGQCLNWFRNYLMCRSYVVKIDDNISQKVNITHGVPQGSKLGPLLYLIYANDMLVQLNDSKTFAYADDTAIVVAHLNSDIAVQTMQKELDVVTRWSHDNGLVINASKTKIMHIRLPHIPKNNFRLKFHNVECLHMNTQHLNINDDCDTFIEQVDNFKYLGVIVDKNFNWKEQIIAINKKLRKCSYVLYHLNNCAPMEVVKQAYFSLAESYIRHGITAFGSSTHCRLIQKTQNRLIKIIMNNKFTLKQNTSENEIRKFCKLHSILNIKSLFKSTLLNEFINNHPLNTINHKHNTRRRKEGRYEVPRYKTKYGKHTIDVQLPTILNSMPPYFCHGFNQKNRKTIFKKYYIDTQ